MGMMTGHMRQQLGNVHRQCIRQQYTQLWLHCGPGVSATELNVQSPAVGHRMKLVLGSPNHADAQYT
jgi:hypothetical protein